MSPELILLSIILAALVCYAILGGADFGAGVWEFNTAMRASPKEKQLIYQAIGPVWEANHVWLIFVLVGLFSGFPPAFALMSEALAVPLLLGLAGITFRGAAYAFRSYTPQPNQRRSWETLFAFASVGAPLFLGMSVGTIAQGQITQSSDGAFAGSYLTSWLTPFSLLIGLLAVGMCAYLAAVFLAREASQQQLGTLVDLWRRRAQYSGVATGILSLTALIVGMVSVEHLRAGFLTRGWPMILASLGCGFVSIAMIHQRKFNWATITSSLTVATVLLGWGLAQYPDLLPNTITIAQAKAPHNVLVAYLITIAIGGLLLIPAMLLLFYLFKFAPDPTEPNSESARRPS